MRGDQAPLEISVDVTAIPDKGGLLRFRDAGVDMLIIRNRLFTSADKTLQGTLDNLSRFAETVIYPAKEG